MAVVGWNLRVLMSWPEMNRAFWEVGLVVVFVSVGVGFFRSCRSERLRWRKSLEGSVSFLKIIAKPVSERMN